MPRDPMNLEEREFLRLVQPHWRSLFLVARRYALKWEDARDLVQETLLRAWRSYSATDGRTYSGGWLFVILRNAVVDWQRTASRRIRFVLSTDMGLTEFAPEDLTQPFSALPAMDEDRFREMLDDHVVAALDELDPAFREVLLLSVAGDLKYREIAEVLDCPIGTVMSRMARARRQLRERLAPESNVSMNKEVAEEST